MTVHTHDVHNSLEIQSGYQAIKHTVILLPAATKHVTILLCPMLGALSKMTEDHTFFPKESALITGCLLALPHLYKCQSKVHRSLWKRAPSIKENKYTVLIVRQQDTEFLHSRSPSPFIFSPLSYDKSCVPSLLMLTITFP